MPEWTTACPDWAERFRDGRSLVPCGALFPDHAEKAMQVFRSLYAVDVQHPEGAIGEDGLPKPPTYGEVSREWILEIATAILGSYDEETGERLIREALLKLPKKQWKSGVAAGLMLTLMLLNWRPSNEAGIIAPTKDTADNVFKPMRDAIEADPELKALFHVQPNMRTITHRVTNMSCRVYAADTDTIAGKKWAFVIFEELWLLAQRKGAEDMMLEATGGQASRPEGVVISITT
jgi:phage terminase large subunit-like protein